MSNLFGNTCRNHDALVHHWYLPDSYDEYIPNDVAPNVDEPDKQVIVLSSCGGMVMLITDHLLFLSLSAHASLKSNHGIR